MLTDDDLRRELTAAFHEQADPIAGVLGNLHAVVNRIGRPRRDQVYIHHRPCRPRIAFVDDIAVSIDLL